MRTIQWEHICPNDESFHLARTWISGSSPTKTLHAQTFFEVFWIERGEGIHLVNGEKTPLHPGDFVWMRPSDRHGFDSPQSDGFVLTNLAFSESTARNLQNRYFSEETRFLWHTGKRPATLHLDSARMKGLKEWTAYLNRAPRSQLEIDRFLIDLLHRLRTSLPDFQPVELPDWLTSALDNFNTPEHFAGGVQALAEEAGRSPEHVNATLRESLGITATEAVNRARMDYAAGQLRISTQKILEICFDCGFENLGHFYKVFKDHFQTTPRTYRLRHLTAVS